jgi:hypothetical protein
MFADANCKAVSLTVEGSAWLFCCYGQRSTALAESISMTIAASW